MTGIQQTVILLILLYIFNGSCVSNTTHPPKDPELIKRINEILDKIDKDTHEFLRPYHSRSNYIGPNHTMKMPEGKLLIENPDISLPLMFKRLDNKKVSDALCIYFKVFELAKSAESIPYITDYISSISEEETMSADEITCKHLSEGAALSAAQKITSLKLTDKNYLFEEAFDQRLDIAKKLRQWYEEYKKNQNK